MARCVYSGVSFSFFPFFAPFFAHFLIFLQTPVLLPSFHYPPCVSVLLSLTHIISQSPFLLFSFLLFSAFPPHSIFFLNILYPSFPHFLFPYFIFFLFPLLRPYFPYFFSFCRLLFLYLFISFASFLPFKFLASSHGPFNCFSSDFLHLVYPLVLPARIVTLGVSTHNLSGANGTFWGHGLYYLWRPQDGHVTIRRTQSAR